LMVKHSQVSTQELAWCLELGVQVRKRLAVYADLSNSRDAESEREACLCVRCLHLLVLGS
jgi:hypothetical protein